MKKNIAIFIVFVFIFSAKVTLAALMPFGGRIVSAPIPGATCPDVDFEPTSPYAVIPANPLHIPGPFAEIFSPYGYGQILPGAWILGKYLPTPIPDCMVGIPPVGTVLPVFKTPIYGTSIPFDLPI
jgi:hypothetical protein